MVIFRNYEGTIGRYVEPEGLGASECPEGCELCVERRERGLDDPQIGLSRLFSGEVGALEPADLERHNRNEAARRRKDA